MNVVSRSVFPGRIETAGGRIARISRDERSHNTYIIPGFIDAHIHVESSLLAPSEFSRLAVPHGTVAAVSDPHEIANVLGVKGVRYMVDNGKSVPFKFHFGAPSCVPASPFETSGASISAGDVENLLGRGDAGYLAEVMNYPGVIEGHPDILEKIAIAKRYNKPIDGHAPGLRGDALRRYVGAGITTDHETLTCEEGIEKISLGMKILIREGSAARNFDVLAPLIAMHPDYCMFCSDDRHPDSLAAGHIRDMVRRAVAFGVDPLTALRCASLNPVAHYGLDVGLIRQGDPADFVVVDNLRDFTVLQVYVNGVLVADEGIPLFRRPPVDVINNFSARTKRPSDFIARRRGVSVRVIETINGQLYTGSVVASAAVRHDEVVSDPGRDILKIAVINRYADLPPAVGFVRGFGIKRGAIASSVAHDAHNVVAVGVTDQELCDAANLVIAHKGGLAVVSAGKKEFLPLPVAGIMSDRDGHDVAREYSRLEAGARLLGSSLDAPFMTLSFMALSVIPALKLTDKGLFDSNRFEFTDLFAD